MAFGKRATGAWMREAAQVVPRRMGSRRRALGTALLGIVLGFGATTAATTVVSASERGGLFDFFEAIFGGPKPAPAPVEAPRKAPGRYSSLPDARRIGAGRAVPQTPRIQARLSRPRGGARPAQQAASAGPLAAGTRTVCVRLCDGYAFPLGTLRAPADLPVHEAACAAACPSARTDLFTLAPGRSELDQAVSLKGQPYLSAAWANVYRRKRVENCACQPAGGAGPLMAVGDDRTLRPGDVVATEDSAGVITRIAARGPTLVDYRTAALSRRQRSDIDGRIGAIRREAEAAAFRRGLRVVENRAARIRTAEASVVRLRLDGADSGFAGFEAPAAARGFAPVRVVAPSPFER